MAEKEEHLYCAVYADGTVKFCREDDILHGSVLRVSDATYYARLPLMTERDAWHTKHDRFTFGGDERKLVVFQTQITLNGGPLVDYATESCVEARYQYLKYEAQRALLDRQYIIPSYSFDLDKPLTYLFLWELPKFKRVPAKGGYTLEPLESDDFGEVISYLETNFASKEDIEQHYRNNAPDDFDDCGIGAYHGD